MAPIKVAKSPGGVQSKVRKFTSLDFTRKRKAEGSPQNKVLKKLDNVSKENISVGARISVKKQISSTFSRTSALKTINGRNAPLKTVEEKKTIKVVTQKEAKKVSVVEIKKADCDKEVKQPLGVSSQIPVALKVQQKVVTQKVAKKEVKEEKKEEPPRNRPVTRLSSSRKSSEQSSLYVSALEDILDESQKNVQEAKKTVRKPPPPGVVDFDAITQDIYSTPEYAMDIFDYLKSRESDFKMSDYILTSGMSRRMRSMLVDWMVELQENFELNHETLYLAVKLMDTYLSQASPVPKSKLQLVAVTAVFLASKYDETHAAYLDEFLNACDHQYVAREMILMEQKILKAANFNLGYPLSYRFLRRYARAAQLSREVLTLARYILESSLLDYTFVTYSDSKLASATLYLALSMKEVKNPWKPSLEYYTGYKLNDFKHIVLELNDMLHKKTQSAVKIKYSHEVYLRSALVPLVQNIEFSKTAVTTKV